MKMFSSFHKHQSMITTVDACIYLQGVREKLCFFPIHCNPSLAYIAVRDLQSSQRNASVQSLLLADNFLYNQKQPSAGDGEVANIREFLEKKTRITPCKSLPHDFFASFFHYITTNWIRSEKSVDQEITGFNIFWGSHYITTSWICCLKSLVSKNDALFWDFS